MCITIGKTGMVDKYYSWRRSTIAVTNLALNKDTYASPLYGNPSTEWVACYWILDPLAINNGSSLYYVFDFHGDKKMKINHFSQKTFEF